MFHASSFVPGFLAQIVLGGVAWAQEEEALPAHSEPVQAESVETEYLEPGDEEFDSLLEPTKDAYATGERQVGVPGDIETDLDTSFPKPDSIFRGRVPEEYFNWKRRLYAKHGLKLALGYQSLLQVATETNTGDDTAWGQWAQIEGKWDVLNRGQDYQGSLVFDLDWRDSVGGYDVPSFWGVNEVGSINGTDGLYLDWDPSLFALFWDQWFEQGVLNLRVGKLVAVQTYDFFRFKDGRTSFTAPAFTISPQVPAPGPGYGAQFKWWPVRESSFYVLGTINDMNGDAEDLDLDTVFDESQFFYGLELGYFWKRGPGDFDHVHLDLFYADQRDSTPAPFPNESGGGFKLLGEKQWDDVVTFASYTYNEAEGGGFGLTFTEQVATAGVAKVKPLDIRGEIGFGAVWADPLNGNLEDQYSAELYWKLLATPDLWITPTVQGVWDPAFQPGEDFVAVFGIKMRLFL